MVPIEIGTTIWSLYKIKKVADEAALSRPDPHRIKIGTTTWSLYKIKKVADEATLSRPDPHGDRNRDDHLVIV